MLNQASCSSRAATLCNHHLQDESSKWVIEMALEFASSSKEFKYLGYDKCRDRNFFMATQFHDLRFCSILFLGQLSLEPGT